jgi:hypothetical protein
MIMIMIMREKERERDDWTEDVETWHWSLTEVILHSMIEVMIGKELRERESERDDKDREEGAEKRVLVARSIQLELNQSRETAKVATGSKWSDCFGCRTKRVNNESIGASGSNRQQETREREREREMDMEDNQKEIREIRQLISNQIERTVSQSTN